MPIGENCLPNEKNSLPNGENCMPNGENPTSSEQIAKHTDSNDGIKNDAITDVAENDETFIEEIFLVDENVVKHEIEN